MLTFKIFFLILGSDQKKFLYSIENSKNFFEKKIFLKSRTDCTGTITGHLFGIPDTGKNTLFSARWYFLPVNIPILYNLIH